MNYFMHPNPRRRRRLIRTPNEIAVKWLELKDAGWINVKHVFGQLAEVAVGVEVESQCLTLPWYGDRLSGLGPY